VRGTPSTPHYANARTCASSKRLIELGRACRTSAQQLDAAVADRDRESLGRAFDGRVAELYGVTPEDLSALDLVQAGHMAAIQSAPASRAA
jgi:hypothetical protein